MTRKEAKRRAELYSILAEGKTIQVQNSDGTWEDIKIETLNHLYEYYKYRIKQEPKYRPFKNKEECWQEMIKHQPFGWVFSKNKEAITFVYYISINYIRVNDGYTLNGWTFDYEEMFDKYTFADGTPFGIKEE